MKGAHVGAAPHSRAINTYIPSPAPWSLNIDNICDRDGVLVATVEWGGPRKGERPTKANACRIVECVNALDGVTDPGGTLASIAGFLEDVAAGCDPDEARTIATDLLALLTPKDPR